MIDKNNIEDLSIRLSSSKNFLTNMFRHWDLYKEPNPDINEIKSLIKYFEEKEIYVICERLYKKQVELEKRKNMPKLKITGKTKIDGYGQRGKNAKHFKGIANLKDQEDSLTKYCKHCGQESGPALHGGCDQNDHPDCVWASTNNIDDETPSSI